MKHCRISRDGRLYLVGTKQFESIVGLVNFYSRNVLYRNIKLTKPVSKGQLKMVHKRHGDDPSVSSVECVL